MNQRFSLNTLLARTGGFYIILVIAAAQTLAVPGALLGSLSIQMSADFSPEQLRRFSGATPLLILAGNLILLFAAWLMTPKARKRLTQLVNEREHRLDPVEERQAWKEITGLTWRYGFAGVLIAYIVDVSLSAFYYLLSGEMTRLQFGYTMTGGLVSVLSVMILAILLIDRLLVPARLALTPRDYETQISGRAGALLAGKLIVLILALNLIAVLMVAPIGFRNTIMALEHQGEPSAILAQIQNQTITVGLFAVILGSALAYLFSRSISDPIRELIDTFKKIESGDLSQRARVTTTDEIAELATHFNRMVARLEELQGTLERQVQERTAQLKATNEVGSVASAILEPDELLNKVVNLIAERFGHYYAAIYLLDDNGRWAELREATGEAGKVLKQNRHRLEVSGKSLIATAINTRKAAIASDQEDSALRRINNPLLPYTRSEIVLPLIVGERVLGALDVQSTREAAFNAQDVDTLQGMANQVAIALENARLYQQAQQNLKEMRAVQKQYLLEAWSKVPNLEKMEYSVGDEADQTARAIEIPLVLREQILGKIQMLSESEISPEEQSLLEAVASQAAIALENARLVSESRQVANQERLVAEISNKIWTSTTIDGVLQTAAKELGRVLDAAKVIVELKPDENDE
jgi:GAF domain-containing protein/HAMP domain-containing protein